MRILLSTIFLFSFFYTQAQNAQLQRRIDLFKQEVSLAEVLAHIEKVSGLSFIYKTSVLETQKKVSINQGNISIEEALKLILYDQDVKFSAVGNQIAIYPRANVSVTTKNTHATQKIERIYDTIRTYITDTVEFKDTTTFIVLDTAWHYDTVEVKIVKRKGGYRKSKFKLHEVQLSSNVELLNNPNSNIEDAELEEVQFKESRLSNTITFGINSRYIGISAGVGFMQVLQQMDFTSIYDEESITVDSLSHYTLGYDSTYIAIPSIDTLWLTEPRVDEYYTYQYDTLHNNYSRSFQQKRTLSYIQIPVSIKLQSDIVKDWQYSLRYQIVANILVGNNSDVFIIEKQSGTRKVFDPAPVFIQNNLSAGAEYYFTKQFSLGFTVGFSSQLAPSHADLQKQLRHKPSFCGGLQASLKF